MESSSTLSSLLRICPLLVATLWPLNAVAQWHQHTFEVMGTRAHVEFWLEPNGNQSAQQLIDSVKGEMTRIDELMSPYIESSQLSKLNREAYQRDVHINAELFQLLATAEQVSRQTEGAFDISYASVGYQYDYRNHQRPNTEAINNSLAAINYQAIQLDPQQQSVRFLKPGLKIDLGGIAKGHAVKSSMEKLKLAGIEHALISAGGDTTILGDRHGRPWYVGIKHPRAENKTAVHLPLSDESISTSGDYERYFVEDGVRYHHIINPKTGDSARNVVSVTVVGKDATWVDALSTAVFVRGLKQGMALIDTMPDYEAIIIDNQQTLHLSSGLQ